MLLYPTSRYQFHSSNIPSSVNTCGSFKYTAMWKRENNNNNNQPNKKTHKRICEDLFFLPHPVVKISKFFHKLGFKVSLLNSNAWLNFELAEHSELLLSVIVLTVSISADQNLKSYFIYLWGFKPTTSHQGLPVWLSELYEINVDINFLISLINGMLWSMKNDTNQWHSAFLKMLKILSMKSQT